MKLIIAALCASAIFLLGFTLPDRPTAHVNDYAHVLSDQDLSELERKFFEFEQSSGHQAAVAIFPKLDGDQVEEVAAKLFEKWKLGKTKVNDGVLLVLAVSEHKARIEVGYGLEDRLPDALAGRIIRDEMVPSLKNSNYYEAILTFEKRLDEIFVKGNSPAPNAESTHGASPRTTILFIILFIVLWISIYRNSRSRVIGSNGAYRSGGWWWWGGGWGGGSGGGWGGGSSGGWGGGGGGQSGGGGASGDW